MRTALLVVTVVLAACHPSTPVGGAQRGRGTELTEVAPGADALLAAWEKAIGGAEALERFGSWHAKGTYRRGGVDGTIEVTQSTSGARREVIVLGFLREERVYPGQQGGWLVDRNGEVRRLAGFEVDEQRGDMFWGTWAALLRTRQRGGVLLDEAGKLVLAPEASGRPDTVTLDPASHLPVTTERRDSEKRRTTRYADWRVIDGVRWPFHVTQDNGNPNDDVDIRWTEVTPHVTLDAAQFGRPAGGATDMKLGASVVEVPIEIVYGGLIFMQVTINGTPMSMILDSGAEATVLNSSRLGKLGLQGLGHFATGAGGGDVEIAYVKGVTTTVGQATLENQIVAAIMLDQLEGPLRRPIDGILGYDFMSRFALEIDYQRSTLRLFDRTTYVHRGDGARQRMTLEDSTPFITGWIHLPDQRTVRGRFVLDTGCLCDVQLFAPFVDKHGLLALFPDAREVGYAAGAGGQTKLLTTTIPALQIGTVLIKEPRADLARDEHGAAADPESAGLIGSVTLGRYVLALDYLHEQFWLDTPAN